MPAFSWTNVTSANNPITLAQDTAYSCKGNSLCIFKLPSFSSNGFRAQIVGNTANWTLTQNANQTIQISQTMTTPGATGSISSTSATDVVEIDCINVSTDFRAIILSGNITIN